MFRSEKPYLFHGWCYPGKSPDEFSKPYSRKIPDRFPAGKMASADPQKPNAQPTVMAEPAPKRSRVPKTVLLTPETVRAWPTWLNKPDMYQGHVLDIRVGALPRDLCEPFRRHCRPRELHLTLPRRGDWGVNPTVFSILSACCQDVEEVHVHRMFRDLHTVWSYMPKLRRLHLAPEVAQSWEFWATAPLDFRHFCTGLTDLTMHGALHVCFLLQADDIRSLRAVHYPDLPELPCLMSNDGWLGFLTSLKPELLPKLEPRLLDLMQRHKLARVEAVADVLPVVGVPELVAALAFDVQEEDDDPVTPPPPSEQM
jgi:hypothetical protein